MAQEKAPIKSVKATVTTKAEDKTDDKNLSPQEVEAKVEAEALKAKEEQEKKLEELIKNKKYFLPIK